MAAGDKPLFLQPIEVLAADRVIEINGTNRNLSIGTYANIIALGYSIAELMTEYATGNTLCIILESDIETQGGATDNTQEGLFISFNLGNTANTVEWSTSFLPTVLGFIDDKTGSGTTYAASYPFGKSWQPTYQRMDQSRFWLDQRGIYSGTTAKGGQLAGCQTGPEIYKRTMNFNHDLAQNTCAEGVWDATDSDEEEPSWGDVNYIYMQERHLERFVKDCRTSTPEESGNLPTNGFYYIQDPSYYVGNLSEIDATFRDGGIRFDQTVGTVPHYYVFCQLESRGSREPRISVPTGLGYYNHKLKFNTCEAPGIWQLYTYDP